MQCILVADYIIPWHVTEASISSPENPLKAYNNANLKHNYIIFIDLQLLFLLLQDLCLEEKKQRIPSSSASVIQNHEKMSN